MSKKSIPWYRILRGVLPVIRATISEIHEARLAESPGGLKITRAELRLIVRAGFMEAVEEVVEEIWLAQ